MANRLFSLPQELQDLIFDFVNPAGEDMVLPIVQHVQPPCDSNTSTSLADDMPILETLLRKYPHVRQRILYTQLHYLTQSFRITAPRVPANKIKVHVFLRAPGGSLITEQDLHRKLADFNRFFSPASRAQLQELHIGVEDVSRFFPVLSTIQYQAQHALPPLETNFSRVDVHKLARLTLAMRQLALLLPNITTVTLHDRQADRLGGKTILYEDVGRYFRRCLELKVLTPAFVDGQFGYKTQAKKWLMGPSGRLLDGDSGRLLLM